MPISKLIVYSHSFLKPYGDPIKVGVPSYKDSAWRLARELADKASDQSVEDRRALLVEHQDSDQEMSAQESDEEAHSGKFLDRKRMDFQLTFHYK